MVTILLIAFVIFWNIVALVLDKIFKVSAFNVWKPSIFASVLVALISPVELFGYMVDTPYAENWDHTKELLMAGFALIFFTPYLFLLSKADKAIKQIRK